MPSPGPLSQHGGCKQLIVADWLTKGFDRFLENAALGASIIIQSNKIFTEMIWVIRPFSLMVVLW